MYRLGYFDKTFAIIKEMVQKSASLMLEHASGTVDNAKQRDWAFCKGRKGQKWRVEGRRDYCVLRMYNGAKVFLMSY